MVWMLLAVIIWIAFLAFLAIRSMLKEAAKANNELDDLKRRNA